MKRIFSILLSILLIASALPFVAFADGTVEYTVNVSSSKVMNDFPTDADTLRASPGITSADGIKYYASSTYTIEYDPTSAGIKVTGNGETTSISLRIKDLSFAGANMVAVWIDGTGLESNLNVRPFFDYGAQKSSGADLGRYMAGGSTYYFIPDGQTEAVVLTATKANSVYNVRAAILAGQKGTYYFPEECFQNATAAVNGYDYTYPAGSWTSFGDTYLSGNANSWYMNNSNYPYANFTLQMATLPSGKSILIDDLMWVDGEYAEVGAAPAPDPSPADDFAYSIVAEDFSDFALKFNWSYPWGTYCVYSNDPGNAVAANEISLVDGRFVITPNNNAADATRFTTDIYNIGQWKTDYKAFSFDLDVSNITGDLTLRPKFVGRSADLTNVFSVYNGSIYFIGDDGKVVKQTVGAETNRLHQWNIPAGFKGKVFIPVETIHADAANADLNAEYEKLAFQFEILNWKAAFNGNLVAVDNFTFYTNVNPTSPFPGIDGLGATDMVYNCQDNSVLYTYKDKAAADFETVCEYFAGEGYEVYSATNKNGSLFATYIKDSALAHIYWLNNKAELCILVSDTAADELPEQTEAPQNADKVKVVQLQNSIDLNTMTYIIRLADGTFIIYDGGYKHMADDILATLNELSTTEKPIVRAWVLTHSHNDHYQSFNQIASYHCDEIEVQNVLVSPVAADAIEDNYMNTYLYNDIAKFPEANTVFVHTGMTFKFAGLNMEILLSSDELYKANAQNGDANNSSIVSRLYADDYSFLVLADIGVEGTDLMTEVYGEYLVSDMCQLSHHGMETVPAEFYEVVKAPIIFCPSNNELYDSSRNKAVRNAVEQMDSTKEILIAGFNTFTREWGTTFDADAELVIPESDVKYSVIFKDAFGNEIDTLEVYESGVVAESAIPAAPVRLGYVFTGWSADVDLPICDNTVFTALYEKDTTTEYGVVANPEAEVEVEVTLPAGQEKPYYNDRITLNAPATNEAGQKFAYWTINGSKFSYASTISFLVFDELNITPVYADEVEENPVVIYTNTAANYVLNGTKWNMQVMGVVDAGEAEVTEIGILLSASEMTAEELKAGYEANNGTVYKMASAATNGRQFLYTVKNIPVDRTRCATVYAVINGELVVGEAAVCMTVAVVE